MAKKFKIAQNPTFKADVNIPIVGGEDIKVGFTFKYLTRKELAEMYDKWSKMAEGMKFEDVTLLELTEQEMNLQKAQIKDIVVGWEYEDEFNDENIEALVDVSVNIVKSITDAYQESYHSAKKGN